MNKIWFDGGVFKQRICVYDEQAEQYYVRQVGTDLTNNQLEYKALIAALKHIKDVYEGQQGKFTVHGDSLLIINHVTNKWALKEGHLKPLCMQAQAIIIELQQKGIEIQLEWLPRDKNKAGIYLEEKQIADKRRK